MENSHGGSNGAAISLDHVLEVKSIAQEFGLKMHLDGARFLNAVLASGDDVKEYSSHFETISFCFSKGMGCPIGSILAGTEKDMAFARNLRKMLGGGMRQAGILAASMQVSMEDWEEKLTVDNANCAWVAKQINEIDGLSVDLSSVHTNMFVFVIDPKISGYRIKGGLTERHLTHRLMCDILQEEYNIKLVPRYANEAIRIVTHRDINRSDLEYVVTKIKEVLSSHREKHPELWIDVCN